MAELKAVELVDLKDTDTETEQKEITLKEEFDWFLGEEFKELLEGFEPSDNSEFVKAYCKKYNISLEEKTPPNNTTEPEQQEEKPYICYECKKVNHGSPVYKTNSLSEYQKHWITSGHKGPCQPSLVDIEYHRWERQGRDWEI